ncbi:3-isopropylmalate dehydratase [Alkalicella caledoniensis]|uniref:3-isopropylmalate dehydratase n=1 Tax=Alkalicella caledoniensis TaxID=2731377 RepID=A0A7G9WB32_ALKCA|nr:3-isopropylmalate dehydratase [Alkalicella caledoniensis]QNO15894.1 3-isopropylmalate dehydratase [Alkalicella caledoniensis]
MKKFTGKVFSLDDNVDTDQILPGYAMSYPENDLKNYTLKGSIIPEFPQLVKGGDIIVAGENFGCGSSREQAPFALKESGVSVIIAKSFARIFRRNAINIGLPVITCDQVHQIQEDMDKEDLFEVDIKFLTVKNLSKNKTYSLNGLTNVTLETLQAGGLMNKVIKKLEEKGCHNG